LVAGAVPILAACASDPESGGEPGGAAGESAPGSAPSSGGAGDPGSGGNGGGNGGGAAANAVLLTSKTEVPVGGGVILDDEKVVVTQPTSGQFRGFSAVCTHQGCTVASVSDGQIFCPCHGSAFDISTGAVLGGPAPSALPEAPIILKGPEILLATE
jgi:Rieske Fe-S protein